MTDRERVARALMARASPGTAWEDVSGATREHFLWLADAALAALSASSSACATCRFWDNAPDLGKRAGGLRVQPCRKALQWWDATEWTDQDDPECEWQNLRALREEAKGTKVFVQDGSDYRADMLTAADFWCAHYAPIPPLPAPPSGEVGVVAIGYANTATGGVEVDNAGIIRRAPGAGKVG